MSDERLAEGIAEAKEVLTTVEAATPVVMGAALDIIEAGKALATEREVDISEIITRDPFTDRALMEAADVEAAIGRTIDWSGVPDAAFEVAGALLSVLSLVA
jgi:myo-inositol catabolism protein IolC